MKVKLVSQTTGSGEFAGKTAEDIVVYAARVSSNRENKFESPDGLLAYCIRNEHWSILETASMTFEIETSIMVSRQLLRHRSFTFQEFSQRYSEVAGYEPIVLRKQAEKNRQSSTEEFNPILKFYEYDFEQEKSIDVDAMSAITAYLEKGFELYDTLIREGAAKECARFILPLGSTTKLFMTGNLRSWVTFFNVRTSEHTQKETREVAQAIKEIFKQELPIISKALNY